MRPAARGAASERKPETQPLCASTRAHLRGAARDTGRGGSRPCGNRRRSDHHRTPRSDGRSRLRTTASTGCAFRNGCGTGRASRSRCGSAQLAEVATISGNQIDRVGAHPAAPAPRHRSPVSRGNGKRKPSGALDRIVGRAMHTFMMRHALGLRELGLTHIAIEKRFARPSSKPCIRRPLPRARLRGRSAGGPARRLAVLASTLSVLGQSQ